MGKGWPYKIFGEIAPRVTKKGRNTNLFYLMNTSHPLGHFRFTDFAKRARNTWIIVHSNRFLAKFWNLSLGGRFSLQNLEFDFDSFGQLLGSITRKRYKFTRESHIIGMSSVGYLQFHRPKTYPLRWRGENGGHPRLPIGAAGTLKHAWLDIRKSGLSVIGNWE